MAITQQQVIKKFMASLDKTTKQGEAAIDEAVAACSKFKTAKEVIAQMLADYSKAKSGDDFLKTYCGINLDNGDTGAITGSDAGGSKIKSGTSVVPNKNFDTSFNDLSFTVKKYNVTFQLAYEDYYGYWHDEYNIDYLSDAEKHIWQALYSFWAEESLKLIEESYGYSFKDSDAQFKKIKVFFYNSSRSTATATTFNRIYEYEGESYIYLGINISYFQYINEENLDGKQLYWNNYYLDRLIAHELTHAVMNAKINNFPELPSIIVEGTAELTAGMDDSQYENIQKAVENKTMLEKLLVLQKDYNDVEDIYNEDYVAGYLFLRYLAKQNGATPSQAFLDFTNFENDTLICGTAYADFIGNNGNQVTINAGAGDDEIVIYGVAPTVTGSSYGKDVLVFGGAGKDYILNDGANATIDCGAGNDTIENTDWGINSSITGGDGNDSIRNDANTTINGGNGNDTLTNTDFGADAKLYGNNGNDLITTYNSDNVLIDGGAGNDKIEVRGAATGVSVIGGAGNDFITLSGGNNFVQYSSGDGKDIVTGIYVSDTIKIVGAEYEKVTNSSSNDGTLKVGKGSIVLKDAKNISFTIDGKEKSSNIISLTSGKDTFTNSDSGKTIYALSGNDNITNTAANVTIYGDAGTDEIKNNGTNAVIFGGDGNDKISLGSSAQNTTINGGKGNDKITLAGGGNVIQYSSGDGKDIIYNFSDNDTLQISGSSTSLQSGKDTVIKVGSGSIILKNYQKANEATLPSGWKYGTSSQKSTDTKFLTATVSTAVDIDLTENYGAKVLRVDGAKVSRALTINGNSSANILTGGKGADEIYGGKGNDKLYGNAGNDTLYGGAGNDTLSGGNGKDFFFYSAGNDVITDYTAAQDKIKIESGTVSNVTYNNNDVIFNIDEGSLTVQNGKGKKITITDSSGKTSTKTYSGNVSARTLDLFDDNNFISAENNLDSIVQSKVSVTQIQTQNNFNLAQDSTILTFTEEK